MKTGIVVEDHKDTREWLADLLYEAFPGIELVSESSVEGGLKAFEQHSFGLALIDISLPDGSGLTLVDWVRRRSPDTYVVMATIFDDDEHLLMALRAGADGYLLKDQPRERLMEQFHGILRGEPPLSPSIARRMMRHFRQIRDTTPQGERLTQREEEVLSLVARGFTRSDIALALGIAAGTVATYTKAIYRKLGVSCRAEAALHAARLGLVRLDG